MMRLARQMEGMTAISIREECLLSVQVRVRDGSGGMHE